MVDGKNLCKRRGVHPVSDGNTALSADNGIFSNQAVPANPDAGLGHAAKIVDMQDGAVHDECIVANFNPAGAGMKINTFIQVCAFSQVDIAGIPQADIFFNCSNPIHLEDHAVKNSP